MLAPLASVVVVFSPALAESAPARPVVVIERLRSSGLLLPSAQAVAQALVIGIDKRCGDGSALLEDELSSLKRLRSFGLQMSNKLDSARAERDQRIAFLARELPLAPYRIRVRVSYNERKHSYTASAACAAQNRPEPLDSAEASAPTPTKAADALTPRLAHFCAVLEIAARDARAARHR